MKLTVKKAMIFYLASVALAVVCAWLFAYYSAWWIGMVIMTLVVADHVRFTLKRILKN